MSSSPFNNVLRVKNVNITSKRSRGNDEITCSKVFKSWRLDLKENDTEQLAKELGIGLLETDEIMNFVSSSSETDHHQPDEWQQLTTQTISANNENTPSCSLSDNKENVNCNVTDSTEQQQCDENDEYCCLMRYKCKQTPALDLINNLSDEVILQIFKWLSKSSLMQCSMVSKRFCRLSRDESLWTRLDLSCRSLYSGALGQILDRGVQIFRLSQTEIEEPAILSNSKSFNESFQCKLQYLDLSMTVISVNTLSMIFQRCKYLKKLSLENVNVNEDVCKYLSQNKSLEVLNMTMVSGLNINCMRHILTSLNKLKELNLAWTHLNNTALNYVCTNLPFSLTRFNIAGCRKTLLDNNVKKIVSSCPNLRELDLSDCISLTADSVDLLLELNNLRFLAMSRCYAIPPASFKKLKLMASLSSFDIHGHMPDSALQYLKEYFGDQIIVNKFLFSSVARPTVGIKRTSIWNLRVKD